MEKDEESETRRSPPFWRRTFTASRRALLFQEAVEADVIGSF